MRYLSALLCGLLLAAASLLPLAGAPSGPARDLVGAKVAGGRGPDGTEIQCDLPAGQQVHNVGGSDGAGLCVFTSIMHAARWQHVQQLEEFQGWMRRHPGGGYPEKVDAMIAQLCKERGIERPQYLQVEGMDLGVIRAACASGRMVSVTYSFSPTGRYNGQRIAHMVNVVHADDRWFVILDNNYPCDATHPDNYEWLSEAEFRRVYAPGWCVVLLEPAPPPPPRNAPKPK